MAATISRPTPAIQSASRPPSWRARLLVLLLALLLPLVALEVALRTLGPFLPGSYRTGSFQASHPIYGRFHVPNYDGWVRTPEFVSRMKTNSLGLRDDPIEIPKPPETFRILVLGDSFVQGSQVLPGQTFADRLEQRLNALPPHPGRPRRYDVVNGGVGGWGPAEEYLWLHNEGAKLQPDLVLQQLYLGNDISDAGCKITGQDELKHKVCFYFDRDGKLYQGELLEREERRWDPIRSPLRQWLVLFNVFETGVLEKVDYGSDEARVTNWQSNMNVYAKALPRRSQAEWEEAWQITAALLDKTRQEAEALGARYELTAAPSMFQIYPDAWRQAVAENKLKPEQWDLERPNQRLGEIASSLGLRYFDLAPAFKGAAPSSPRLYYQTDLHFSPAGHVVVAEALEQELVQSGMVP